DCFFVSGNCLTLTAHILKRKGGGCSPVEESLPRLTLLILGGDNQKQCSSYFVAGAVIRLTSLISNLASPPVRVLSVESRFRRLIPLVGRLLSSSWTPHFGRGTLFPFASVRRIF